MGIINANRKIKYLDGGGQTYNPASFTFAGIDGSWQTVTDGASGFLFNDMMHARRNSTATGAIEILIVNRHWQFKGTMSVEGDAGSGDTNYEIALFIDGVLMPESLQKIAVVNATFASAHYHPTCISTGQYLQLSQIIDLRIRRTAGTGNSMNFKTMSIECWMD